MTSPQRSINGITNVKPSATMGQLIIPDPTSVHVFMEDFHKFNPGDWVTTRTETPSTAGTAVTAGAETITDATGGVLQVTLAGGDNDSAFFQWKGYDHVTTASEIFTLESGKKLWMRSRQKISNSGDSDFIVGLQSADTTPLTSPVDNLIFKSDDDDDFLDFQVYKASVASLNDVAVATIADDTWFTSGAYWDGVDTLEYFYNNSAVGKSESITQPTAAMSPIFGLRNGSAAARILSIDFLCVIKER